MNSVKTQHQWESFLKFYSEQNKGRKTRMGVFEKRGDVTNDYWIEAGLAMVGIDIEINGELPTIELLLEGYSHSVANARNLKVYFSSEGDEDGMDITHDDGNTTILRFEKTQARLANFFAHRGVFSHLDQDRCVLLAKNPADPALCVFPVGHNDCDFEILERQEL